MKHKIVLIPPVYLFICIIGTMLLRRLVPSMNWIGYPFTLGGLVFFGAGVCLDGWRPSVSDPARHPRDIRPFHLHH